MKLVNFRIKNYKSILNSGSCEVEDDVTVLAGINESGKTNILDAINKLRPGEAFNAHEKTLGCPQEPEISAVFRLSDADLDEILKSISLRFSVHFSEEQIRALRIRNHIEVNKSRDTYLVGGDNYSDVYAMIGQESTEDVKLIKSIIKKFQAKDILAAESPDEKPMADIDAFKKSIPAIIQAIKKNLPDQVAFADLKKQVRILEALYKKFSTRPSLKSLQDIYLQRLPEIVFFKSFDEERIKDSMPIAEARENRFVMDLARINKAFDIDAIDRMKDDDHWVQNFEQTFAAALSRNFMDYWDLNNLEGAQELNIKIRIANNKLTFFVSNPLTRQEFFPSQRSKGFQWFLSFYTRILSAFSSNKGAVILIDEPGLFLHAKTQQSILKILNQLAEKNQIIYATHSPYLIEADKLQRVRLVQTDGEHHTFTVNKFYYTRDKETLMPIVDAIGHAIFRGISFDTRVHNVHVEDIGDYLILYAMAADLGLPIEELFEHEEHFVKFLGPRENGKNGLAGEGIFPKRLDKAQYQAIKAQTNCKNFIISIEKYFEMKNKQKSAVLQAESFLK